MKKISILLLFFTCGFLFPQTEDENEIFLIDNFVTPEEPHLFKLSFFTSLPSKSKLVLDKTFEKNVTDEYSEDHKLEVLISEFEFNNDTIPFVIIAVDSLGRETISEVYEIEIPYEPQLEEGSNFLLLCLFSGVVFGLPSPGISFTDDQLWYSLNKEIPLVSIRGGLNYPLGYFAMEYSHTFDAPHRNIMRFGYKHMIELPLLKYLSPGVNFFTNYNGFNGISPEVSLGWFKIYNTFTVYSRYRFNVQPGNLGPEFHEFYIGLYSSFFSIYL